MTTVEEIKDEKHNKVLTEKQQNYQHYKQTKTINIYILQGKKNTILWSSKMVE